MPYQVQHMLKGKGAPICVTKDESVSKALTLMIENDFSQLPVLDPDEHFQNPTWMITYEGILRGIRNFKAKIEDLKVRDVMINAPVYSIEDDLFDILDRLKDTNAVLITEVYGPDLAGIITSYDTAEYFRSRAEDMMWVEDIELMVKDFIKLLHTNAKGEVDDEKLSKLVERVTADNKEWNTNDKLKGFDDLTLNEYVSMLVMKENWHFYEPFFSVSRELVRDLLLSVRKIRNELAHFRGEITTEQRDQLRFAAEWLARCQEEYQRQKNEEDMRKIRQILNTVDKPEEGESAKTHITGHQPKSDSVQNGSNPPDESRYSALADFLQNRPGGIDTIQLSFNEIEEIIGGDLPVSARKYRAWWSNDALSHNHSQLWLDAGWRTTYINLSVGKITFNRIQEREKAYINFFSALMTDLRKKSDIKWRDAFPDGASWITIQTIPAGTYFGAFVFAFSRSKRMRVELYLDLEDKERNKTVFDKLFAQKDQIEAQTGPITWERLENRRASRLAIYHEGSINDEKPHPELRKWAVETMIKFYNALCGPAEAAILEAKNA